VTREQVKILQLADNIYIEEIRNANLYDQISQAFAVLLPVKAVGVMGDKRTYEQVIALRAVQSEDFMTADWYVQRILFGAASSYDAGSSSLRTSSGRYLPASRMKSPASIVSHTTYRQNLLQSVPYYSHCGRR
jgi:hypothetical protein